MEVALDARGYERRRIETFCRLLEQGAPLPAAIEQSPRLFGEEFRAAARIGAQNGMLKEVLADTLDPHASQVINAPQPQFITLGYLLAILSLGCIITSFICVKIIPTMREILLYSGDKPAGPVSDDLATLGRIAPLLINGFFAILAVVAVCWVGGRWNRSQRIGWLAAIQGWTSRIRTLEILKLLHVAKLQGKPIAGVVSSIARHWSDPFLRARLLFVRNEMEHGVSPWKSMHQVALLTGGEARALETADRLGNTTWMLNYLADGKSRLGVRRMDVLRLAFGILGFALAAVLVWLVVSTLFRVNIDMILRTQS